MVPRLGPAIHLIAAQENYIAILRITVNSLEQAPGILKREQLLSVDRNGKISINRSRSSGANICLVD
jgi:hypothetical protein